MSTGYSAWGKTPVVMSALQRRVERPLSAEEVEAMRAHMEQDLREQLVLQGAELDPETLATVRDVEASSTACVPALVTCQRCCWSQLR